MASAANTSVAICVLTKGYPNERGYKHLIKRNISIIQNVLPSLHGCNQISFSILIFHEGNISISHQEYIRQKSQYQDIQFIDVSPDFQVPSYLPVANSISSSKLSNSFPIGYKSMCRFWFCGFLEQVKTYDFICRIDEDCIVHSLDLAHIVNDMINTRSFYRTGAYIFSDNSDVSIGLQDHVNQFTQDMNIAPIANSLVGIPATNVFILDLNHIRDCQVYKKYSSFIDASGGIFAARWGDALLWAAYLSLTGTSKILTIDNKISYFHGSGSSLTEFYCINYQSKDSILARGFKRFAQELVRISYKIQ